MPKTMHQVEGSSTVAARGYDPETKTMRVTFKNRAGNVTSTYEYPDISAEFYEEFVNAPSAGVFVSTRIRKLPCTKL